MDNISEKAQIEAILFTMGEPVEIARIAGAIGVSKSKARSLVEEMKKELNREDRGIRIVFLDDACQMCTKPEMYDTLIKLVGQKRRQVLTDVLMETLAIIAYKQPVTKAEIEHIRGVKSDFAVNKLIEYELVEEAGRLDAPGRPAIFATTQEFMRRFGIESSDSLPFINEDVLIKIRQETMEETGYEPEEDNTENDSPDIAEGE